MTTCGRRTPRSGRARGPCGCGSPPRPRSPATIRWPRMTNAGVASSSSSNRRRTGPCSISSSSSRPCCRYSRWYSRASKPGEESVFFKYSPPLPRTQWDFRETCSQRAFPLLQGFLLYKIPRNTRPDWANAVYDRKTIFSLKYAFDYDRRLRDSARNVCLFLICRLFFEDSPTTTWTTCFACWTLRLPSTGRRPWYCPITTIITIITISSSCSNRITTVAAAAVAVAAVTANNSWPAYRTRFCSAWRRWNGKRCCSTTRNSLAAQLRRRRRRRRPITWRPRRTAATTGLREMRRRRRRRNSGYGAGNSWSRGSCVRCSISCWSSAGSCARRRRPAHKPPPAPTTDSKWPTAAAERLSITSIITIRCVPLTGPRCHQSPGKCAHFVSIPVTAENRAFCFTCSSVIFQVFTLAF